MPAELQKQIFLCFQRFVNIKSRNAPAGSFSYAVMDRNDQHRPVKLLQDSRRDNADYTRMPVISIHHKSHVLLAFQLFQPRHRFLADQLFDRLPLRIDFTQFSARPAASASDSVVRSSTPFRA